MTTHLIIPDTQCKPGVPLDHLGWIGQYIADRRPDVVVHLGDHWDMPSLSTYDRGKLAMEGRRYSEDIEAGNEGMRLLTAPTAAVAVDQRRAGIRPAKRWKPRLVLLRGNHENRVDRFVQEQGHLDGTLGLGHMESPGWEVHDFLKPVFIDGIGYAHYWAHPMTGKPYGGMMETRLKNIGHSFTMGHVQTLQTGMRFIHGEDGPRQQRGLVAGACYLHDEDYKGFQGNAHWRGILVKHEVRDGQYDLMEVSLDYLCQRYEGMSLTEFIATNYPDLEV